MLSRIPDIFSYDTESIYGVTRHIDQVETEHHPTLRKMAFDWLSENGVHENTTVLCDVRKEEMTRPISSIKASNCQENKTSRKGPAKDTRASDERIQINDREIRIVTELNELLSARTNMINERDVAELTAIAGHSLSHLIPFLLVDIVTTEFSLSPDFTDEEIHDVATTVLESWSDDLHVRQKIMLDAIVEYRTPAPPKCTEQKSTSTTQKAPESELILIYRQQLTIAALQGLCANPAYCVSFEELPGMATLLANSIINQQGEA